MLYVVPTPVGHLGDMTHRALDTLRSVELILAEDTRTTHKLLAHYDIPTPLRSYHAHNEHQATEAILRQLTEGRNIALVSDAGTPGISDPGFLLVRACREAGVEVTVLPGPTAFVPALVGSGFPCDRFYFEGFLPHKKGRQTRWAWLATLPCTIILYESPYRLLKCLEEIRTQLPADTRVCVAREISKIHETFHFGSAAELIAFFSENAQQLRGEIVIVISPGQSGEKPDATHQE